MLSNLDSGYVKPYSSKENITYAGSRDKSNSRSRESERKVASHRAARIADRGKGDEIALIHQKRKRELRDRRVPNLNRRYSNLERRVHRKDLNNGESSEATKSTSHIQRLTHDRSSDSTYVSPGQHVTISHGSVAIAGANGCTAIFLFGTGRITCGHLRAGKEGYDASNVALAAKALGIVLDVEIIAPKLLIEHEVFMQVRRVLGPWVDIRRVVYDDRKHRHTEGHWTFRASVEGGIVRKSWKDGSSTSTTGG